MKDKQAINHYIAISPDYDYYYKDDEGKCGGSTDDVIENYEWNLQPKFNIIIPGIAEWCERYVLATDFADTTTDPSFDWRRWHRDDLLFAKELYRQLPRNYKLIYRKPFEDCSRILNEVDFSKDSVDDVIRALGSIPDLPEAKPALKYNVTFTAENTDQSLVTLTLRVGNLVCSLTIHDLQDLQYVRKWMEGIAKNDGIITRTIGFNHHTCDAYMIPQRIGQFTQMGQIRIEKSCRGELFSAYVNRHEFVRGLYLTLMTHFGFGIYTTEEFQTENYPKGEELVKRWQPYNILKSDIIEWYITDDLYYNSPIPKETGSHQVNETVVIFPDCGCCMWDTMGVGSGNEEGLHLDSGEYDMNIPGLGNWINRCDYPDVQAPDYESWWEEGWRIAKEIRKRLPPTVDLYYMCFDPTRPDTHPDYNCSLPRLIVPFQS